jgi:hypothetical protein
VKNSTAIKGDIAHTMTQCIDGFNAAGIMEAHKLVEAGSMMGKVVVTSEA